MSDTTSDGVEIVDVLKSNVMTPLRFVTRARLVEWRKACHEYLLAFPRSQFPHRVSPWWTFTAEVVRDRIASGRPYTKEDEPVVGPKGEILVEGTDVI